MRTRRTPMLLLRCCSRATFLLPSLAVQQTVTGHVHSRSYQTRNSLEHGMEIFWSCSPTDLILHSDSAGGRGQKKQSSPHVLLLPTRTKLKIYVRTLIGNQSPALPTPSDQSRRVHARIGGESDGVWVRKSVGWKRMDVSMLPTDQLIIIAGRQVEMVIHRLWRQTACNGTRRAPPEEEEAHWTMSVNKFISYFLCTVQLLLGVHHRL